MYNKCTKEIVKEMSREICEAFKVEPLTEEEHEASRKLGIAHVLQLSRTHKQKKDKLGGRVQVLRKLIRVRYDSKRLGMTEFDFANRVEKYLDNILPKYGYDVEIAIDELRKS